MPPASEELVPDVLLMLEHWPVYTRGRRSAAGELPMGEEWYAMQGIEMVETDRGGKVTYHGPGQLVGYPIVRVDDVRRVRPDARAARSWRRWLRRGSALARGREDGTGLHRRVGRRAQDRLDRRPRPRGVTTHGFAVNVENDLQPFEWVVPCGLDGVQMTSLIRETGRLAGQMKCFRRRAAWRVAEALGRRQRLVSLARLERAVRRRRTSRRARAGRAPAPSRLRIVVADPLGLALELLSR